MGKMTKLTQKIVNHLCRKLGTWHSGNDGTSLKQMGKTHIMHLYINHHYGFTHRGNTKGDQWLKSHQHPVPLCSTENEEITKLQSQLLLVQFHIYNLDLFRGWLYNTGANPWTQRPHTMRDCARLSLEIGFLVTSKVSRTNLQTCDVGGQSNFGGPYNKLATGQLERHLLSLVELRDLQYELCRALDPLWHVILWGSAGSSTKCNILNFCQACALLTWMIPVTWGMSINLTFPHN